MARPKVKEPKKQYTIMLKPSVVKEIDRIAEKLELSRSQMMSNIIDVGLGDVKLFDKMGILDLSMVGGKLASSLKEKLISGEVKIDDKGDLQITK